MNWAKDKPEDEEIIEEEEEDNECPYCQGTGIGQHGDPDTSKCSYCHGRGHLKTRQEEEDDAERADYEYDRMKDERAEREADEKERMREAYEEDKRRGDF